MKADSDWSSSFGQRQVEIITRLVSSLASAFDHAFLSSWHCSFNPAVLPYYVLLLSSLCVLPLF
jgi:hypothetical protein